MSSLIRPRWPARWTLAWGAEVVATADYPPDLYVPDRAILRRATAGRPPPSVEQRAAYGRCGADTARVLRTLSLSSRRQDSPWPRRCSSRSDLAVDQARGLELLDTFDPRERHVSGDRSAPPDVIVLAGGGGSATSRLVQVVAKLTSVPMGPYAVIGGLAVSCRLAQAHRATGDVDTLVETTSPTASNGSRRPSATETPTQERSRSTA